MSEKKALKREVKAVWDRVKRLRAEYGKSRAPEEIEASADQLDRGVQQLRALAKQLSALNAMPPDARPAQKGKKSATRGVATEKSADPE